MTAGQAHDGQIVDTLLDHLGPRTIVLADKAYDADRIREMIHDQGATPNIPPKSNRKWKPCFSKRLIPTHERKRPWRVTLSRNWRLRRAMGRAGGFAKRSCSRCRAIGPTYYPLGVPRL
ncbi:hypothetical protein GCM10007973_08250 [Polymorphobacter multimanifer]|uniref:Transposase n=1 Tax=Polymorphobacter multimanifer TaxID=1070431 RepID=A0A841L962_9SPHN|nr:transposase [Polymorphobacter multimanifer]GGI73776.1 hypothetical protein GCM10007973_08250 [Polymorphobacter multimanifer]